MNHVRAIPGACLALALFLVPLAHADIVLHDDAGRQLHLERPAQRIVTLAPHLAELVFDAGAGERLVGAVEWSNSPPQARDIPRVGDSFRVDAERIVAMQPDVVLAWGGGTPQNTIERLRALGLPVAVLTPEDLASIPRHIEWLGVLTGNAAESRAVAGNFRRGLRALREKFSQQSTLRVFYQISGQPLFTVGKGHTITELIEVCGGENIFDDLDNRAHSVSREAVISRNPQVIIAGHYAGSEDELAEWQRWKNLQATRSGNLYSINAELVARPAASILDGGRELCETLDRARRKRPDG